MSCFGCHFKIKNFTMSTCLLLLLLLLLCPPKYDYYNFFREIIVFTEKSWKNTYVEKKKNFLPAHIPSSMSPIVYCRPLPSLIAAMSSTYICIIKKNYLFPRCKNTEIFSSPRILTSNIYALSLNPQKKKNLRGLSTTRKSACWWRNYYLLMSGIRKKKFFPWKWLLKSCAEWNFFLPCSPRATSSEEQQKCLFKKKLWISKKSIWKKTITLKKTNNIHLLLLLMTPLKEKKNQETTTKIHEVTSWRLVWTKKMITTIFFVKNRFHGKMAKKISLMLKTMRKKMKKICSKLAVYAPRWKFIQKKPNFSHSLSHFRIF